MGNNGLPRRCPRVFDRKRMTKLILVRHGHVEGISPERFRGRAELPLTETGRREAAAAAVRIAANWQIGRAAGRGRGEISVVAVSLKKKKKKSHKSVVVFLLRM